MQVRGSITVHSVSLTPCPPAWSDKRADQQKQTLRTSRWCSWTQLTPVHVGPGRPRAPDLLHPTRSMNQTRASWIAEPAWPGRPSNGVQRLPPGGPVGARISQHRRFPSGFMAGCGVDRSWAGSSTSTRRQPETAGQAPWPRSGTRQAADSANGRQSPQVASQIRTQAARTGGPTPRSRCRPYRRRGLASVADHRHVTDHPSWAVEFVPRPVSGRRLSHCRGGRVDQATKPIGPRGSRDRRETVDPFDRVEESGRVG